ncbi:hypothetical protein A8B78_01615 [Jannaschia sp. EhC01]|nr:hypothetical protein A8B78_01615 [Jannaschia sp. EhC01]
MQGKCTTFQNSGLPRLFRRMAARLSQRPKSAVPPRPGDIPDYLRTDVGLEPRAPQRPHGTDPPRCDPFRLL